MWELHDSNATVWVICGGQINPSILIYCILLYEPYANESSQICHFLAERPQFDSDHHKNRRLSSHSYSHESVIVCIFWINIC